jgi:excisionase family DNA binding protein
MSDVYTAKQVQEILKVDRITIYRMLQDGRLKGIKIGHQWRFNRSEVDRLLGIEKQENGQDPSTNFPTHCLQTIQDLFSDISQTGSLIVDLLGTPITTASRPCVFCEEVMSSPHGREACQSSWREMASASQTQRQTHACHAGLQYVAAPIYDQGTQVGAFITGMFYLQQPDRYEESERVKRLASKLQVSSADLNEAILSIPVIPPEKRSQIESWPRSAAQAVHSILEERTGFINRLQKIADLTQIS